MCWDKTRTIVPIFNHAAVQRSCTFSKLEFCPQKMKHEHGISFGPLPTSLRGSLSEVPKPSQKTLHQPKKDQKMYTKTQDPISFETLQTIV